MTNKMQLFWLIYLFVISSTCFVQCLRPSSEALDCIYSIWYCPLVLLLAGVMDEMELQITNKSISQNSCILLVIIYSYTNDARTHERHVLTNFAWLKS